MKRVNFENSFWSKYTILALSHALNEREAVRVRIESVIKFKLRRALSQKQTEPENVIVGLHHHLYTEKTGEKQILLNTNRTFHPQASKTENRVGRKGVTYRYRDNETSVPGARYGKTDKGGVDEVKRSD